MVLLRVGLATVITGVAFMLMGWLDPSGGVLVVFGAFGAAIGMDDLSVPERSAAQDATPQENVRQAA